MTWRVLVSFLVAVLVVLPAAQQASAPSDDGHAAALKHAPRTPPTTARIADVARPLAALPPAALAGSAVSFSPDRLSALGLAAPFVPPRV
jgi:hypothetical protein